jgi:hypothetical protein
VIDHSCCAFCDIDSVDDFEAVNRAYAGFMSPVCELVDCDSCDAPPESEHFAATCNAGSCEIMDIRKSELSACTTDADCRLRAGLSCCEDCSSASWVAVSVDSPAVLGALCGPNPLPCPPCVPIYPEDLIAVCGSNGHCELGSAL